MLKSKVIRTSILEVGVGNRSHIPLALRRYFWGKVGKTVGIKVVDGGPWIYGGSDGLYSFRADVDKMASVCPGLAKQAHGGKGFRKGQGYDLRVVEKKRRGKRYAKG